MADSKQRKGILEWATMIFPMIVVAVSVVLYVDRTKTKLDEKCVTFTEAIKRIEDGGTSASAKNALDIAAMKPRLDAMDKKLDELTDGQKEMIRYLRNGRQPGTP